MYFSSDKYISTKKSKVLPQLMVHGWGALISVSLALNQIPALRCETTDKGLVHRAWCANYTPQLSLVLIDSVVHKNSGQPNFITLCNFKLIYCGSANGRIFF